MIMDYKQTNLEKIIKEFNSDPNDGLQSEQVEKNHEKYGSNEFDEQERSTLFSKILEQFKEVMNLILVFAGFLSLYISISDPDHGFAEPIIIFLIVLINMSVTIYSEGQAEDAIESLKNVSSPKARVIRDGNEEDIEASEVVQGDILLLNAGEGVAADVRLIEANNLQTEETSLTGESVPIDKNTEAEIAEDAPLAETYNMAFSGTTVTNGKGKGVVVGIGMDSEIGSIAGMLSGSEIEKTPLQKRIDRLAKILAIIAFSAGALIFMINFFTTDTEFLDNLLLAVTLGIAAVPETLPVIVTITLAYGVSNMADRHAIIRNMPAVETLGSASVIASDKTGTLTQNKMKIQKIWTPEHKVTNAEDEWNETEGWLLKMMALASNADYKAGDSGDEAQLEGDPTEVAIISLLEEKDIRKNDLEEKYERMYEFPFDSEEQRMTTIHKYNDEYLVVSKGAFERVFDTSDFSDKETVQEVNDDFAEEALRVLALSYKILSDLPDEEELNQEEIEEDMELAGMVGMIDPPRKESIESVKEAINAGIRPIMITGDNAVTATAIAKEIGIADEDSQILTGQELEKFSDEDLKEQITDYSVYARVSPEDKIRIVEAWQSKGEVVAMTGDGVNDAPSLQAADVGTAMGESGTEVAKNASDMILTNDNFETIVQAVKEGRRVYENIKKTVYYLLGANVAEILIMLITAIIGWGTPLRPIHLLYINVIADGIPGFGFSFEKAEADIMKQDPIPKDESIFARGGYRRIGVAAVTFIIVTLIAYYVGGNLAVSVDLDPSFEVAQTMAFLTLAWSSILQILVLRRQESIFKTGITENKFIFWTTILSFVLTGALVGVPVLAEIFSLVPLSLVHWSIAVGLSIIIIPVVEVDKWIINKSK